MQRGKAVINPGTCIKRPVKVVDAKTGENVGEYNSVQDVVEKLNVPQQTVIGYCKKNRGIEDHAVYLKRNLIFTYNDKPAF